MDWYNAPVQCWYNGLVSDCQTSKKLFPLNCHGNRNSRNFLASAFLNFCIFLVEADFLQDRDARRQNKKKEKMSKICVGKVWRILVSGTLWLSFRSSLLLAVVVTIVIVSVVVVCSHHYDSQVTVTDTKPWPYCLRHTSTVKAWSNWSRLQERLR